MRAKKMAQPLAVLQALSTPHSYSEVGQSTYVGKTKPLIIVIESTEASGYLVSRLQTFHGHEGTLKKIKC